MSHAIALHLLQRLVTFATGLLFGVGLMLAGMTDPGKVIGFLDLFGTWDPSLALVMGGAIAVGFFAFRWARHLPRNAFGGPMHLPQSLVIDKRLLVGSWLFGLGWGLAGFCPGPAWVSMGAGMVLFEWFERLARQRRARLESLEE